MFILSSLVLAVTIGFDGRMEQPKPGYVVSFRSLTGYPVEASLNFATKTEAEAFAARKTAHGYAVRVDVAK